MVERQLRRRGIVDERVLSAMATVPREHFVDPAFAGRAYADSALPLTAGQTISQPWVVAAICSGLRLRGGERVLEVGTGSGYSTAILALLGGEVISIERHAELADGARVALAGLELPGAGRVEIRVGDGSLGAPDRAPFEAIAVHATAPAPPPALIDQLAPGGRLVLPVAEGGADMLTVLTAGESGIERRVIAPCRFVPLVGEGGFGER